MGKVRPPLTMKPHITCTLPDTAMVMAAGLGKRMRPLTATRPKPLIEVAGRSLLDRALDNVAAAVVRHAVVNAHYFADQIEAAVQELLADVEKIVAELRDTYMKEAA